MSRVRTLNTASTSTGASDAVHLYQVCNKVSVAVNNPSTKTVAWKTQGSIDGTAWYDLTTATSSTGSGIVHVTSSTLLFNQARIVRTAVNTTGDTLRWTIAGTP